MEKTYDFIKDLDVTKREEFFIDIARTLEHTARDAFSAPPAWRLEMARPPSLLLGMP
ncbi:MULTISPECIES: hypothetical protein [Agrobacterium]|uniref:hypothetical protein n=1 Tax=Agrobacterium TaxID=357 RepID=UPI0009C79E1A|nr:MULTISPECIES: hypothetical protein [Agrobacterium]CUX70881.1 hypothetical protein AGR6A_pAt60143 [Agrobacterium sp. NCPPB 925]